MDVSGTPLGNGSGQTWTSRTTGARTVYEHDNNKFTSYGYLYNWYALSDSRGICPTGWHVSTDSEWTTLSDYLGGSSIAGEKLKEMGTVYWSSTSAGVTNPNGFSARGAGVRKEGGLFDALNFNGLFWTATEASATLAWWRILQSNQTYAFRSGSDKFKGLSVRCLKD